MHRAAEATVEAGLAGEDFREGTEEDEVLGEVLRVLVVDLLCEREGLAVKEGLHDVFKLTVFDLAHCRVALGKNFAVRTVRTENLIIRAQD